MADSNYLLSLCPRRSFNTVDEVIASWVIQTQLRGHCRGKNITKENASAFPVLIEMLQDCFWEGLCICVMARDRERSRVEGKKSLRMESKKEMGTSTGLSSSKSS